MAIFPTYQQACFALDPAAGLNASNQWKDSAPYQLDVVPVNFVAPGYGITQGASGAPYILFNGTTQRGTLSIAGEAARFYAVAPTTQGTVAIVARHTAPAATDKIFSCENVGATRGINVSMNTAARIQFYGYDAAGALTFYPYEPDDSPYESRTRVTILSGRCTDAFAARWVDRQGRTPGYAIAASPGPIAYDAATIPTVGCRPDGFHFFDGNLYFLGIWPFVWSDSEAKAFSDYWIDRT